MEPDDIKPCTLAWEDIYIPEFVPGVMIVLADYDDWELQVQISAQAVYAHQFLNPN